MTASNDITREREPMKLKFSERFPVILWGRDEAFHARINILNAQAASFANDCEGLG